MANSPAFSLQGSIPKVPTQTGVQTTTPTTPAAKALNNSSNFSTLASGIGNAFNTAKNVLPNLIGNEYKAVGNAASGAYNYLTAPSGTSYSQANPTQPFQYTGLLGNQAPNFQTTSGQNTYQAPPSTASLATLGQNAQPASAGVLPATQQYNASAPVNGATGVNPNAGQFGTGAIGGTPSQTATDTSGSSAGNSTNNGSVTYPGLISSLSNFNTNANPQVSTSQGNLNQAINNLKDFEVSKGQSITDQEGRGIPIEFVQGRQQAINRQGATTEAALQSAVTAAQQAVGQSQTSSQQQLSALQSAASGARPDLGSIGQVPFNPLTQGQGSVLGSTQPGGVTAAGNLLGQFSGAQTAGAALGGVTASQTQQVEGYKSALQQGKNLQSQLTDLVSTFGLNPNDLNAANIGIQKIAQNTSSPQYKILANYVNDIANTYSQILTPPGGSATDTTRGIATSMLDATASGQSLLSVMQSLDNAAQAKIAGVQTTGGSSGGSSVSGFGWNGN